MNSLLLVDLDDTLLVNPIKEFMPAYISRLGEALRNHVDPQKMVARLFYATEKMVKNSNPEKTLEQVFDENFYPALGLEKNNLQGAILEFYDHEFNELQSVTRPIPEAPHFIERAKELGCVLIIATNPLFPQKAMQARLKWAGFYDLAKVFSLITSYEGMHFAKPNPAYFAEILGLHGWPQVPCGMVGNSLKDDIEPAAMVGLPGFWVTGDCQGFKEGSQTGSMAGGLRQASAWLDSLAINQHQIPLHQPEAVLAILRSSVAVLKTFANNLGDEQWKFRSKPDEPSILELVSHLCDVEIEIHQPRIQHLVTQANPFIAGVDSDLWRTQRDYQNTRSKQDLEKFIRTRIENINTLSTLSEQDWQKPAQHSFFGPTTLVELLGFAAQHDMNHIREIYQSLHNAD